MSQIMMATIPFNTASQRRNSFTPINFTPTISTACLRQVEFYFSEFNLPYDKFLRSLTEQNDGWVPISTLATFNRMKKFRPIEKVVEVLKTSKILEISEDGENVRRIHPFKEKNLKFDQIERTIVICNFPHEDFATLNNNVLNYQDDLEIFINKITNDNVNQIRLRRDKKKKNFNGIVFVEFKTKKDYQDFLLKFDSDIDISSFIKDDDNKTEPLFYKDKKLTIMSKKQYNLQKQVTNSKSFGGSGQRSRSFTGHRKNLPSKKKLLASLGDSDPEYASSVMHSPPYITTISSNDEGDSDIYNISNENAIVSDDDTNKPSC